MRTVLRSTSTAQRSVGDARRRRRRGALGIVVGNGREELRTAVDPARVSFDKAAYAEGILEGFVH